MRRGWTYFVVTLALWAFVPELRRLIDWRIGFQAINLLAVLPLAALIPLGVAALRSWPAVPPVMRIVAWLWLGGFVYAFVVALTSGGAAAAAYTFAEFVLPLCAGLWASTSPNPAQAFRRLSVAVLAFAAIASLYGIVQYVAIPPWDAYWMQNADIGSAGKPLAFQVRVFGTLNAPGPFADFAMVALILAIGALGVNSLRVMAQIAVTVIALALSLVRSAWLALAVGVVTFVCLSPRPLRALAALAATAAVGAAVVVSLPTIIGADRVNDDLSHRLSTLADVGSDESANDRELQVRNAWIDVQTQPLGSGLGTVGTATKLSTASQTSTTLDSGFLSRLVEMGYPGFACYLAAIALALAASLRTLFASREREIRALAATSVAVQVALVAMDLSGDVHMNLMGILSWTLAGLAVAAYPQRAAAAERAPRAGFAGASA